jgi:hypothetical protein
MPQSHAATYDGFGTARFADRYFGSTRAHGALLLSTGFYEAFRDYEFILVHHLDALVFADRLAEWCAAGYDYVGAPWIPCADTPHITAEKVGNGGLSLRRVESFLRVLRSPRYFLEPEEYWRQYAARTPNPLVRAVNQPRRLLKRLSRFNDVRWHVGWALDGDVHEDRFWAEYATHYDPTFRIAPVEVAMRFSVEAQPRVCFERIGRQIPFGAHRWARYDRSFFEPLLITTGLGSGITLPAAAARTLSPANLGVVHR